MAPVNGCLSNDFITLAGLLPRLPLCSLFRNRGKSHQRSISKGQFRSNDFTQIESTGVPSLYSIRIKKKREGKFSLAATKGKERNEETLARIDWLPLFRLRRLPATGVEADVAESTFPATLFIKFVTSRYSLLASAGRGCCDSDFNRSFRLIN